MNLIIDEGNTRIKLAIYKDDYLVDLESCTIDEVDIEIKKIVLKHQIKELIVSSVTDKVLSIISELAVDNKVFLSNLTPVPFKNKYKTPKTLGVDRVALVTAAFKKFMNKNCLVIDAGTCITYDFITSKGCYLGGAIAPGLGMRLKGMHVFTEKLPKLTLENKEISLIGTSTETSMQSGVFNGMVFEIEGFIRSYKQKYGNVSVILTGGDANFLYKQLKNSIFVNPNFLLEGLNEILTYQNKR